MVERIEFTGSQGDRLAARLDLPARTPDAYAVFAHCFTCSKDVAAASCISRALAAAGIGVLRFDFTGLGHSGGARRCELLLERRRPGAGSGLAAREPQRSTSPGRS